MGQDGRDFPEMTPKAAEAFADFVNMGPGRSLRKLHDKYRQQGASKSPTVRVETLFEWSTKYAWQDRLASAVTILAETRLEQASEIDSKSFLRTSELIADRLEYTTHDHLDAIIKVRESVRKPAAKTTTVNITLEIRQRAEQIAAKYGVPVAVVIEEAEAIAAGAWDSWSPPS